MCVLFLFYGVAQQHSNSKQEVVHQSPPSAVHACTKPSAHYSYFCVVVPPSLGGSPAPAGYYLSYTSGSLPVLRLLPGKSILSISGSSPGQTYSNLTSSPKVGKGVDGGTFKQWLES